MLCHRHSSQIKQMDFIKARVISRLITLAVHDKIKVIKVLASGHIVAAEGTRKEFFMSERRMSNHQNAQPIEPIYNRTQLARFIAAFPHLPLKCQALNAAKEKRPNLTAQCSDLDRQVLSLCGTVN